MDHDNVDKITHDASSAITDSSKSDISMPTSNIGGAREGDVHMVTNDVSLGGLSASVAFHTESAQKEFWALMKATDPESGYVALSPERQKQVLAINEGMSEIVKAQHVLIAALANVTEKHLESAAFRKVIEDLEQVVLQEDSAISDVVRLPETLVRFWRSNLDLRSDLNSHLDNYVESFRMAFDESCSGALADLASLILAEEAVHEQAS